MPHRYCGSRRSPLHADDGHSECISCLGKSHADAALAGSDCSHCESISLASLRTHIAFFSESDPAPRTLPFSSSQGPVRKKQRGRGSQRPVESELTLAQIPRASLLPHREISPVLFIQPDQRPSASPAAAQSRPRTAPTQQPAKPAPAVFAPQPVRTQQPRGRSRSARCHPLLKRQGPRLKIALDPAPPASS